MLNIFLFIKFNQSKVFESNFGTMAEQRNRCHVNDSSQIVLNHLNCKGAIISQSMQDLSSKLKILVIAAVVQFTCFTTTSGYQIPSPDVQTINNNRPTIPLHLYLCNRYRSDAKRFNHPHTLLLSSDDWSSFQAMDDDDVIVFGKVLDKQEYAVENDSQDEKEAVGALRSAPIIERNADPISVPAGKTSAKNTFTFLPI
jgi:hypothetical protein